MKIANYLTTIFVIILLFSCNKNDLIIDNGHYKSKVHVNNKDVNIVLFLGKSNRGFITVETNENQTIKIKKFMFLKKNDTMWLSTEFEDNVFKYLIRQGNRNEIVISSPNSINNQGNYLFDIDRLTSITLYKNNLSNK